jgi:ketosteroid isomerase-like protein
MTRDEAQAWAEDWAGAWNRLDIEAVLAHVDDAVVWTSPKALPVMGQGTLHGKDAVRSYLGGVPSRVTMLRFTVRRVIWDPVSRELAIIYDRDVDGVHDRASEILHFASSGRVDRGEVHYGVIP